MTPWPSAATAAIPMIVFMYLCTFEPPAYPPSNRLFRVRNSSRATDTSVRWITAEYSRTTVVAQLQLTPLPAKKFRITNHNRSTLCWKTPKSKNALLRSGNHPRISGRHHLVRSAFPPRPEKSPRLLPGRTDSAMVGHQPLHRLRRDQHPDHRRHAGPDRKS